jgi:LytS/YehU family sensor histidine kinase
MLNVEAGTIFVIDLAPDGLRTALATPGRWLSPTGSPWVDFLLWCGAVVLVSVFSSWIFSRGLELKKLRDARDHALRLRIAPGFIFETLSALRVQLERDPREGSTTIDRLSVLYRQLQERTDRPTVPLREELAFAEAYLGIERLRLGDRLRVAVDVPEALESLEVPTLGLQVLVEDAVKHGVAPRAEGGEIRIRAWFEGPDQRELCVAVEHPAADGAQERDGTGLETLRARLPRPGDLRTAERDGRFQAELHWKLAEAGA